MTLHPAIEYLKYARNARGRHGTHSPFVYDLVEHVLMDKGPINRAFLVECPEIPLKYENLICRIAAYYDYAALLRPGDAGNGKAQLLVVDGVSPSTWVDEVDKQVGRLGDDGAVIVTGIHESRLHGKAWKTLCEKAYVTMCIDVYGLGMLLFRKEFKERQYFTLKY